MTDKSKSKKLLVDLDQAVQRGDVSPEVLELVKRGITIGGSVNDSVVIEGHHNIVVVNKNEPVPLKTEGMDEQALLAESVKEYHQEQTDELGKVSTRPYPGLLPYRLQDARHFFGREQSITELLAKIQLSRVTWLHGRSGTGKSSIIEAGLMPTLLEHDGYPILVRAFGELPTIALKKKLLKSRLKHDSGLADGSLQQFLTGLSKCLHGGGQLYIFFDQFEEFFTKLQDESKPEFFAQELADCVADTSLPVHFIFSLLTDKFGETLLLRERLLPGAGVEAILRPLNRQEAMDVITGPFKQLGVSFEDGLVETILKHLESAEIGSPQLQLVCEKLFQSLPKGGRLITFTHYKNLHGTEGIIKDYLKQALHDEQIIPADLQTAATYLMSTLVTPEGERDVKKISEWYVDERFRSWTLAWHKKQKNLPLADGAPGLQSIRHIAVVNYIRKIEPHVTIKGDDLRQIIQEMDELILDDYLFQLQKEFINNVTDSLRNARLIREIQVEDGELAYELVHDYLIAEVKDWLDEDEKDARKLRRKLDQQHLDFAQHKSLLDSNELEIVASQLGNPRFTLLDTDKRLILLSAAAQGTGQKWLTLSGSKGLNWLREAYQDESYPSGLRQGAAALLGEVSDQETFDKLLEKIERSDRTAKKRGWVDLLAHYLNRSTINHRLSWSVKQSVFLRQAGLRIKEGADERWHISRVAVMSAFVCGLITFFVSNPFTSLFAVLMIALLYAAIASVIGFAFAQVLTSTVQITKKWLFIWQSLTAIGVGGLIGAGLFLSLGGHMQVWFAGGIIALAQAISSRDKFKIPSMILVVISSALICVLTALVLDEKYWWREAGYVFSVTLFSAVYLYSIGGLNKDISLG